MKKMRACRRPKVSISTDNSRLDSTHSSSDFIPDLSVNSSETCETTDANSSRQETTSFLEETSEAEVVSEPLQEELETSFPVQLGAQIDSDEPSLSSDHSSDEDDDWCITTDDSKAIWKAWLQELSKENIKMLSIMLWETFVERFGLTKTSAAKESALCLGVNEKTIRIWRKDFLTQLGDFSESKQGRHSHPFILDDENLRHTAAAWVRNNSSCKGQPNMTADKFCDWVNAC